MRPEQNGGHFAYFLKYILLNVDYRILQTLVSKGLIDKETSLIWVKAWQWTGTKPPPKPMVATIFDTKWHHKAPVCEIYPLNLNVWGPN